MVAATAKKTTTTQFWYKNIMLSLTRLHNICIFLLCICLPNIVLWRLFWGMACRVNFPNFLLLHSNSQLANLFSSPAKNASWTSTPQRFTVSDRANQGSSDTREDAQCTATTCPWEKDSATSPSTPSYGERFQHSLVFMWRTQSHSKPLRNYTAVVPSVWSDAECCWGGKSDLFCLIKYTQYLKAIRPLMICGENYFKNQKQMIKAFSFVFSNVGL